MALEQTYNKEGKTSLMKGISQNPGARGKYITSAPFLSHVSENVKAMAQLEKQSYLIPSSRCILQSRSSRTDVRGDHPEGCDLEDG